MTRFTSVLVALGVVAATLFAGGAARADRVMSIYNWDAFVDMVVDDAHGRVFVTDTDGIYAFNFAADEVGEVFVRAAGQMTMSPDGTQLVVASEDGIEFLNPLTLATVRVVPVAAPCLDALAVASGLVFFSYGDCAGSTPGLGALNPADDSISTGLTTGVPATDVQLTSVATAPNMLVATFGGAVSVLDTVGGATPSTSVRASTANIGAVDLALTSDGSAVLVADGSTSQKTFTTVDLQAAPGHAAASPVRAVGVRSDGMVAVGSTGSGVTDLAFYPSGSDQSVRSIDLGTGRYPAPRGLAFGGKRAFVVSTTSAGGKPELHQIFAAPTSHVAITTDKTYGNYDGTVTVTVRIGGGATGIVNLYEKQYGIQKRLVKRAHLDPATGTLSARTQLRYNTTFTAEFEGDDDHGPGTATKAFPVRTKLILSSRLHSMSGPYHLVARGATAFIHGESLSPIYHGCVKMVLSVRRADGSWRGVEGIPCLETTMSGTYSVGVSGLRPGTRARITASYAGGSKNAASLPTYYYLLFK